MGNYVALESFNNKGMTTNNGGTVLNHAHLGLTENWVIHGLPSGYVKITMENGPFTVDFPIESSDFP